MTLRIKITMDNAAFDGNQGMECARILREFANGIEDYANLESFEQPLADHNGNQVGDAVVSD